MEEEKETWYERINAPYETVDETRRELFETLDWQKAVAKTFAIFSSLRKENNKVIGGTEIRNISKKDGTCRWWNLA